MQAIDSIPHQQMLSFISLLRIIWTHSPFSSSALLFSIQAVAHDHKKDYTYGHYGYYGYHPIDIKTTARTGMNAVMMAAHGLSKIKDEIGSEQKSLESNLKAARKMTAIINQKIGGAVTETMKILDDATAKAKAKLNSVKGKPL